ncbi:MAG: tetratricopeptide repeat protein [Bacteroidota bacterium]|nr:tetratricopeptide repeat protein [Bacteroidota bacterium]
MKKIIVYNKFQKVDSRSKFLMNYILSKKIFFITAFSWVLMYGCVPVSYIANAYVSQGQIQDANGKYDSAIISYSAAIKKDANNAAAYQGRAMVYSKMNKMNDAMNDINKAISLEHKNWEFYYSRATLFEKQEMYNQAITDYTTYISKADKKAGTTPTTIKGGNKNATPYYLGYWGRGKCNLYTKRMDDAIQDFSQSIKYNPAEINLYSWRAGCYFDENKYSDAAKDYEVFLAKNPKSYKQQFELGTCYYKMGEKEKALSVYTKFAEYDPSIKTFFAGDKQLDFYNAELRRKLTGQFLEEANVSLEEAKAAASKALIDVKLTLAFEKLRESWGYALNITKEDRVVLDTIISKMYYIYPKLSAKPNVPEYVRRFTVQANSSVEEKNYNDAIEKYQLALGITPYYPFAHFNLAMLYSTVRQYKKAIDQMNSYLKLAPDAADARAAQDKIYEWEIKVKD